MHDDVSDLLTSLEIYAMQVSLSPKKGSLTAELPVGLAYKGKIKRIR